MEQSLLTATASLDSPYPRKRFWWLRYFFSEDASPDNWPIVELQRRATWLGFALVLHALSELSYVPQDFQHFNAYLYLLLRVLSFVLVVGSFASIWMAFRRSKTKRQGQRSLRPAQPWQYAVFGLMLLLTLISSIVLVFYFPPQFSNDGTSLDMNAAELLVQGRNPYTDSSILDVARQFEIQPDWTTPLRQGQLANRLDYPTKSELQTVMDTDAKEGSAPEFESRVSYPALSFLTLVPFALLKNYNVLFFYLLCYLLLIAIAWKVVRPELRPWVILLAVANIPMWSSTLSSNLDILSTLFIVLAWLQRDHRWRSALFLGLAVATKQIAWFFVPFYLIMAWRHYGFTEAIRRLTIAGCIGLAINLPFILWNPQAWLGGVLAPVADPMFPTGIGLIDLSAIHILPFFPTWIYDVLEAGAMLLAFAWYWRICRKRPEAVMLLAVFPLLFAWRSLPSYFYCAAYPIFILMSIKRQPGRYRGEKPRLVTGPHQLLIPAEAPLARRYSPDGVYKEASPLHSGYAGHEQVAQRAAASRGMRAAMRMVQFLLRVILPRRLASARSWFDSPAAWSTREDEEGEGKARPYISV